MDELDRDVDVKGTPILEFISQEAFEFAHGANQFTDSDFIQLANAAMLMFESLYQGGKILVIGNGGSAAQAQHLAAELMVKFRDYRYPLPAIALTTDAAVLTACGNDYSFGDIFARQVTGLATSDDCLVALSTSGDSNNIIQGCGAAQRAGASVIGIVGESDCKIVECCDLLLTTHFMKIQTARIQEIHLFYIHVIAAILDDLKRG